VAHTFFWRGEFDRAIEFDVDDPAYVSVVALVVLGRREEAAVLSRRARAKANTHLLLEKAVTTGLHSTSASRPARRLARSGRRRDSRPCSMSPGSISWRPKKTFAEADGPRLLGPEFALSLGG
jgi:hypothetical protein